MNAIATETTTLLAAVDTAMRRQLDEAERAGSHVPALADFYGMLRYHLGWVDERFAPAHANSGKRLRPLLLLRVAAALGADPTGAVPAAAAVELLHNFTLVHDDVQDQSSHRRHRETVWRRWGAAQAINVGDALYALAHTTLYTLARPPYDYPAPQVLALARDFDRTARAIVEGQYLDLAQEGEWDGGAARYLAMIEGKTAAIMAFAARAGATLAGASASTVATLARFGLALGLAFQVRDDILGIWGASEVTGKPAADDIRRRKQSLPLVMLAEQAEPITRAALHALYSAPISDEREVARVLALLAAAGIAEQCQAVVARYHDEARAALATLDSVLVQPTHLYALLDTLVERAH